MGTAIAFTCGAVFALAVCSLLLVHVIDRAVHPRPRKPFRSRYRSLAKLRWRLRGARNYAEGYAWSPVQRWRCCGHTTPFHDARCLVGGEPGA